MRRLSALLVLALIGHRAAADEPPPADDEIARAHFATGLAYYRADRFGEAVTQFLVAYRRSRKSQLLYNIACAYEHLDDPGPASSYFQRYLAAIPGAAERTEIESKLYRWQPRVATLTVRVRESGAQVFVDGELVGLAPIDRQLVSAGRHHVAARLQSGLTLAAEVNVAGGASAEVRVERSGDVAARAPAWTATDATPPSSESPAAIEEIARAHFATGLAYYRIENYPRAVEEFRGAYRLSRRSDFLYNIGCAYEHLDDPGRAASAFERYLALRPDAPERIEIQAKLYRLQALCGTLRIHSALPGSEIHVDGELIGLAPVEPLVLTRGRHHVEARYSGRLPATADVEVAGGTTAMVEVDPQRPVAATPRAPLPTETSRAPVLAIAVGALAIASLGIGAALLVSARLDYDTTVPGCTPRCSPGEIDPIAARVYAGYALLAVGGAAAAADLALWIVHRVRGHEGRRQAVAIVPFAVGVQLGGAW